LSSIRVRLHGNEGEVEERLAEGHGGADVTERRLGSTEVACVAGLYVPALSLELPKTKTACDVWLRLRYGLQAPRNERMTRGNAVEPVALDYYREHVGPAWRALPDGEFWTVRHPRNEWFTASPDAFDSPKPRIVIEAKSQSEWARKQWGTPGTDQMATRFLYQCAWLMACCEAETTHVLCMFGHDTATDDGEPLFVFTEPALYVVDRDAELEAALLEYGERFIQEFVLPGIPPPVKPAHNRRAMKERLTNERGANAVFEWESRCIEYAARTTGGSTGEGTEVDGDGGKDEGQPALREQVR
jgi:hypothetical protein